MQISGATRNKVMAILAGGLVLGVGGTVTLASWIDTEWVYGGDGSGGPGVGTSVFDVQQDTSNPFAPLATDFADFPDNPGGSLAFGPGALVLTPGDVVYAPVALRTTAASIGGGVVILPATAASGVTVADSGDLLWNALELRVGVITTTGDAAPPACDAAGFASYNEIANGTGLGTFPVATPVAILGAGANTLHYCFEITLPDPSPTTLQGRTVAPAWEFEATSD